MSRYLLTEIITNEQELIDLYDLGNGDSNNEPICLKGYGLCAWLDDCVVGWDEPLNTYFLQSFEECIDDCVEPVWWLGAEPNEISTFSELCDIINAIFEGNINFKFINAIKKN